MPRRTYAAARAAPEAGHHDQATGSRAFQLLQAECPCCLVQCAAQRVLLLPGHCHSHELTRSSSRLKRLDAQRLIQAHAVQAATRTALEATLSPGPALDLAVFEPQELRQQLEAAESIRAATKCALDAAFANHAVLPA